MIEIHAYQRLERAVSLIARHPSYPGKQDVVHDCLNDLEERFREGALTLEQKTRLVAILMPQGACGPFPAARGATARDEA